MARAKRRGHFCWVCGRVRSNESFSGRGHARHVCKACSKLGRAELEVLQAIRDFDRLFGFDDVLASKRRPAAEKFLAHPNERVREHARARLTASEVARLVREMAFRSANDEFDPDEELAAYEKACFDFDFDGDDEIPF